MKNLPYLLLIFVLTCCTQQGSNSREKEDSLDFYPPAPSDISRQEYRYYYRLLKKYFDSTLLGKGFNGQLLVAKNGVVIFGVDTGFADLRTKDSLTFSTPLHIASTSKTFTGMAILHLVQNGKLNLDDSLGLFFPGFPYPGVTVKMLLSHRSGLPDYLNFLPATKQKNYCYTNQDILNSLYHLKPQTEFNAGSRFSYSNTNFVLLALIIEKITGESYPAFLKKLFFDPLLMTNTFVYTQADSARATPSFQGGGAYWQPDQFDCTYGDKNIYSTAPDLLKWDQAVHSGSLVKKELLDPAFAPLSNERPSIHNYGLGWRMMIFPNGKKIIYHNGRWHGSNSVFVRLPDEKVTIIALGNKFSWRIYSSAMRAMNIFNEYMPGIIPLNGEAEDLASKFKTEINTTTENTDPAKTLR